MYIPVKVTSLFEAVSAAAGDILFFDTKDGKGKIEYSNLIFNKIQDFQTSVTELSITQDNNTFFYDTIVLDNNNNLTLFNTLTSDNNANITVTSQVSADVNSISIPSLSELTENESIAALQSIVTAVSDISAIYTDELSTFYTIKEDDPYYFSDGNRLSPRQLFLKILNNINSDDENARLFPRDFLYIQDQISTGLTTIQLNSGEIFNSLIFIKNKYDEIFTILDQME